MGDSAKKWLVAAAVAIAVIIVAAISVGRMERVGMSAPSQAVARPESGPTLLPSANPNPTAPNQATSELKLSERSEELEPERPAAATGLHKAAVKSREPEPTASIAQNQSRLGAGRSEVSNNVQVNSAPQDHLTASQSAGASAGEQVQVPVRVEAQTGENMSNGQSAPAISIQNSERSGLFRTSGNVSIDGEFTKDTSLVFADNKVVTPNENGALLTGTGNIVTLTNGAQFTAQPKQFLLDSGGSDVNTSNGLAAKVKEYTITPVLSGTETHYDINWADDGVYVYARQGDVDISAPCRSWRVKEGQGVKIKDPRRCAGIVWLDHTPNWPKFAFGAMGAAGTGVVIWFWTHQDMSPVQPSGSIP
jgi:hypothetical protein